MVKSYWWGGWVGLFGGWVGGCGGLDGWHRIFCVSSWHFENGASSKIEDVLTEDGGLLHVLTLAVHLNNFLMKIRVDHYGPFLLSELFCGTPPSCFDDVLAEDGELLHVLPLAVHLNFF